jgi:monomeric sarcosine oxidase
MIRDKKLRGEDTLRLVTKDQNFDVAVIGAGVFGAWTALQLSRSGGNVALLDAYGPGNSRASSGGESRIIRMGYGPDEIYTRMAESSLALWLELFLEVGKAELFQPTGVLWLARDNDLYCKSTLKIFAQRNIRYERLDQNELRRRYPQLDPGEATWGILEPDSGVLMARRAVLTVVEKAQSDGVVYMQESIRVRESPSNLPSSANAPGDSGSRLKSIITSSGREIFARDFVFACGPWLPRLFPGLLADLIHVTRQEVFFFGVPGENSGSYEIGSLPAWIDFNDLVYGIPNLDRRGFKVAIDEHGPVFDPDSGDRMVAEESLVTVRAYLARRMPGLAGAPVTETRVCQYENTSNGDFLIDRHPAFANVWLVGGGSGHGFKHGPAIGQHVAALISGEAEVEQRFSLATKETVQERKVY